MALRDDGLAGLVGHHNASAGAATCDDANRKDGRLRTILHTLGGRRYWWLIRLGSRCGAIPNGSNGPDWFKPATNVTFEGS